MSAVIQRIGRERVVEQPFFVGRPVHVVAGTLDNRFLTSPPQIKDVNILWTQNRLVSSEGDSSSIMRNLSARLDAVSNRNVFIGAALKITQPNVGSGVSI